MRSVSVRRDSDAISGLGAYTASLKFKLKVLDFIKSGGPTWTVDGTIFEMWLGAPTKARSLTGPD